MKDTERRRDRHEIVAEILQTALNGRIKTHIMYRAKLSYSQVNEFLPMLVERGFLENAKETKTRRYTTIYKTTEKGRQFIESLKSMEKLWESKPLTE
jgi:predicted transcriptional regulator